MTSAVPKYVLVLGFILGCVEPSKLVPQFWCVDKHSVDKIPGYDRDTESKYMARGLCSVSHFVLLWNPPEFYKNTTTDLILKKEHSVGLHSRLSLQDIYIYIYIYIYIHTHTHTRTYINVKLLLSTASSDMWFLVLKYFRKLYSYFLFS
jgi:hypothetical protein